MSHHPLYVPRIGIGHLIDRALETQQRVFGSLPFGPLYIVVTICWVHWALHFGWDNSGLTIYTFGVSVLAIYFSWVVTNILNRTAARDRARDDLSAKETDQMLQLQQEQMLVLADHRRQLGKQDEQLACLTAILTHFGIPPPSLEADRGD